MIENLATLCFGLALIHTFLAPRIARLRVHFRKNSVGKKLVGLLCEVELIFGFWSVIFFLFWTSFSGLEQGTLSVPIEYLKKLSFTESVFVFVIMTLSSSKPLLTAVTKLMTGISQRLSFSTGRNLAVTVSILGPLLGSLITEPAAMTVCCFLLLPLISSAKLKESSKYLLLGLLFVNISVGGTLTNFAAPAILVVARPWGWSTYYTLTHFGWRSVLAIFLSTLIVTSIIRKELDKITLSTAKLASQPSWVVFLDAVFVGSAVLASHKIILLFGIFLTFVAYANVTSKFRDEMKLKASFLVGVFLAGLVTLGGLQEWWIRPLISAAGNLELFWSATALTAIVDNALLTYLGTLVPALNEAQRYALMTGAVCGGGLTVIANAPNPIGYSLLKGAFGEGGISAPKLFLGASIPTTVAALLFLV